MKIFYSPDQLLHSATGEFNRGGFIEAFECPKRAENVFEALLSSGLTPETPPSFPDNKIERIHDSRYLDFLKNAYNDWRLLGRKGDALPMCWPDRAAAGGPPASIDGRLGYFAFDIMTPITEFTHCTARAAADTALAGATWLASGKQAAFSLCRPPGHHAGSDFYGGYCFLNNAALAAQHLLDAGASRIAIFDPDYHHGNGTQQIFYERSDVLYVSIHADPATDFPFYTGYENEIGRGEGLNRNLNLPLSRGADWSVWSEALKTALRAIENFKADAMVVSLGVDALNGDPLSHFRLKTQDFSSLGRDIAAMACPTLFVLEGGYAIDNLGECVLQTLQGYQA